MALRKREYKEGKVIWQVNLIWTLCISPTSFWGMGRGTWPVGRLVMVFGCNQAPKEIVLKAYIPDLQSQIQINQKERRWFYIISNIQKSFKNCTWNTNKPFTQMNAPFVCLSVSFSLTHSHIHIHNPPIYVLLSLYVGFPGDSKGKESACNMTVLGSIPGWGRSPGKWNGHPLQYSCL